MDQAELEALRNENSFENILDVVRQHPDVSYQMDADHSYEIEICGQSIYVNPGEVRKKTKNICETINKQFIDLAKMIFLVRGGKLYKQWGYSSLEEYCVQELNVKKRKATYLMNIYGILVSQLLVREDDLEDIGWTRSKDIVRLAKSQHATIGNVGEWIDKSKNYTTDEFTDYVTQVIRGEKDEVDKPIEKKYFFRLEQENIDIGNRALSIARKIGKTDSDSMAFLYMCMDFLSGNAEEAYDEDVMCLMMKRLEDKMNVNITIESGNGSKLYPKFEDGQEITLEAKTKNIGNEEKKVFEFVEKENINEES